MLQQQLTRSIGSLAPIQETHSVSWCQAEGYRNGRSAPNQWAPRSLRVVVVVVVIRGAHQDSILERVVDRLSKQIISILPPALSNPQIGGQQYLWVRLLQAFDAFR